MTMTVTSPVLVGRQGELEALDAVLAESAEGRPAAALVSGEAGVGKSRLLAELAVRAAERGTRVLVGHCVELAEGELPYAPIIGALRALSADLEPDELEDVLGRARSELTRLVPDLASVSAAPASETAEPGQARLFELLLGVLGRLSRERPLALVVEDIHWADRSTCDLLRFLVRNAAGERLAIIATYRSDELHRRHPLRPFLSELEREPRVRRVTVEPLSRDEVAEQVDAILGVASDARTVDRLFDRAEGNPFFTEELLAASTDSGELPDSLRDVLLVRLERLGEPTQRVLRAAAAAGRRVDHRLLSEVAGMEMADLLEALREAVAAQVLVSSPRDQAYEFRHALLREAAYDDLLPGEREGVHLAIARTLAARPELAGSDTALAAELAYHWFSARELALALPASIAAGREAERVYAYAEAMRHFERALEIWDQAPEQDVDRIVVIEAAASAANQAGEPDRAAALIRLAIDRSESESDAVRASLLHERLGKYLLDGAREAEARVAYSRASELMPQERTAERAYVLGAESRVLMLGGYMAAARVRAEEAIALARQIGDRAVEMSGLSTLAGALGSAALFDEAEETGRQALALVDQAGVADELGRAYGNAAEVVEHAGRVEESLQTTLDGVAEARRRGAERSWGAFLSGEAARRMLVLGRIAEASAMVDQALAMGPTGIASTSLQQGRAEVELALGDKQSARAAMDRGMTGNFELSLPLWDGQRMAIAAELELWDGDPDSALRLVMGTLERLEERECLMYTAPLYALGARAHADKAGTARVLKRAGDVAAARAAATALADRFDSVAAATLSSSATVPHCDAWRAQLDAESTRIDGSGDAGAWRVARQRWDELGAVLRSLYCAWREVDALLAANDGDRAMAREVLRDAHAIATRHGARLMLGEFEALARRARIDLSGDDGDADPAAAPSPAEGAGLTPREAAVLALVAEGRTNRQIGEELFISAKTASVHVSRILAKLDATNRGEAAAMAHRLGISVSRD